MNEERTAQVLAIVRREMLAYAWGWRGDWSDFDGRQLRDQIVALDDWVDKALANEALPEFPSGSEFRAEH